MTELGLSPIGVIHTRHTDVGATPVQTALNRHDRGRVVLDTAFADGLTELDGFDYVWLLTWLGPVSGERTTVEMCQTPYLMTTRRRRLGIFAMRGPRRPNPIGLHLVRLIRLRDDGFDFAGVDMVDGTPCSTSNPGSHPSTCPVVVNLSNVRNGWFDEADLSAAHTPNALANRRSAASTTTRLEDS